MLDRRLELSGSFTGTAVIERDEDGYSWRETGTVSWDGRSAPAFRNLALRIEEGRWWMTFADGRPFHPWRLDEPVVHPCAADTYRGRLTLDGDRLRVLWDVTGPTKQHRIITTHRRRPH